MKVLHFIHLPFFGCLAEGYPLLAIVSLFHAINGSDGHFITPVLTNFSPVFGCLFSNLLRLCPKFCFCGLVGLLLRLGLLHLKSAFFCPFITLLN